MRNTFRTLAVTVILLAIIIVVPNVFANTTILSNDPVHAEQFSFYCEPYLRSFEVGKHYMPQDGSCVYSIPATVVGTPLIALYRGTPGNSVLESGDGVFNGGTLIRQEPNVFSTPSNSENFFAVVYSSTLDQGGSQFHDWLTSGGDLPEGAIEGQNFYIIPWKWGPKPVEEFDPVVIVPGIMTTWQTDSDLILDPIFNTYDNLVETFIANGYVEDVNLFTLLYDWEDSNVDNAGALGSLIAEIKSNCDCTKVDLVGHGMGGLIATHYIQSSSYAHDVDEVVMLGTPFFGLPAAYRAWEGGEVSLGNPVQDGLAQALLAAKAAANGNSSIYDYIQDKPVSSFLELTPAFNDYLSGQSYPNGYPQNVFLENLLLGVSEAYLVNPTVRLYSVLGDNGAFNTVSGFEIIPSTEPPKWPHGEPTVVLTEPGDGVVPRSSIELIIGPANEEYSASHEKLPSEAKEYVFAALNNIAPSIVIDNTYTTSCVLMLTVSQGTDLQITDPNGDRLGKDFDGNGNFEEIARSIYSGPNFAAEYLAVANPIEGVYQVRTQGTANSSFTLTASDVCNDGANATTTEGTIAPGQVLGYSVTVDEDEEISIEPLDTLPPNVTINTPANGTSYLTTQNLLISTTITDPEGSPLALTTYRVNGSPVNHLQPLATSSLATSTLVVAATDVFGNTGYATSTFAFRLPPPDPEPPASTNCLVVLDSDNTGALKLGTSAQINFQNCGVQVNSSANNAVDISGSSKIVSNKNCFVGTLKKTGSATISPQPTIPCPPVADPYANHAEPSVGSCNHTNMAINSSQIRTLNPGVYCGGINVGGSAQVTLNPGLYILRGGPLTVNSSARVTGNGVSFFLTGTGAAVNLSGSAQVKLTAMSNGILDGFVFFLDKNSPFGNANSKSEFNGSAQFNFNGIVYLPTQALNIGGSANSGSPIPSSTFIVNTAYLNSSAQFKANGAAN